MFSYAVVDINGKQYKVEPKKEFLVSFLGDLKTFECEKVLMMADGGKLNVGEPFLKEKLKFDVISQVKGKKIRVAKYHAKANTRKVTGSQTLYSKLVLAI